MQAITNATGLVIHIGCSKCKLNQPLPDGKTHICHKDGSKCDVAETDASLKARGKGST